MDAEVEDLPGAAGVLGPPALGGVEVPHQDRAAAGRARARAHGMGADEPDQLPGRMERMVSLQADDGGPAHLGARAGRLLAAQDRVLELDGGDVGEAGDHDLRELLGGAGDVQGGADAHPGVVEQPELLAGRLCPAGESLQFGGVPQRDHSARRPQGGGEPLVDREEPVAGQVHLVGGRALRREQLGEVPFQSQLVGVAVLRVRRQVQQPAGLVVGQQQPAVAPDDQHPFTYRVQDRVVVLVHPCHLGRAEAVGLPPQPAAHERRPGAA